MRIHLSLLALTAVTSAAFAQTPSTQLFEIQGKQTSFTSRGNIGTGTGEILQGFHSSHLQSMFEHDGNTTATYKITQFRLVHQDQNCASRETFDFVLRGGTDTAGPTGGTGAGLIAEVKGINLPNSTRTTACAWGQWQNLSASAQPNWPVDASGNTQFLAFGARLNASPSWTMDGHSVHTSFANAANPHHNSWNHQVTTGNQSWAWQFVGTATMANQPSSNRSFRFTLGKQDGTLMQLGCGTGATGYGYGGSFPMYTTSAAPQAFKARLRGGTAMNGAGTAVALAPLGLFPVPVGFGTAAKLRVNPGAMLIFFGPTANTAGQSIVNLAPFIPQLNPPSGTKIWFQGAMDSATGGTRLTNAQAVEPK